MQHLSGETLARLAEESATGEEALHLERCSECRMEIEEHRDQLRALASLPELPPPPDGWAALSAKLAEERLTGPRRIGWTNGWMLRAAAALALFLGGTATGALAFRATPAPAPTDRAGLPADPEARLKAAEEAYVAALTAYSSAVGADAAVDPLNRLAALEGIVLTTRAALEEAPADPVINGYHLSALGQRDAILRQIDADGAQEPWF